MPQHPVRPHTGIITVVPGEARLFLNRPGADALIVHLDSVQQRRFALPVKLLFQLPVAEIFVCPSGNVAEMPQKERRADDFRQGLQYFFPVRRKPPSLPRERERVFELFCDGLVRFGIFAPLGPPFCIEGVQCRHIDARRKEQLVIWFAGFNLREHESRGGIRLGALL